MKIVGVIFILFGLLLFVGGMGAAVFNRATVGQNPNCEAANWAESQMEAAYKAYQEAKGTAKEIAAAEDFRSKGKIFDLRSKSCAERNQQYSYYFLGLVGIGVIGFITAVIGVVMILIRRRRQAKAA